MDELDQLLLRPEVPIFIWIGAICTHILSFYSTNFKGTIPFLMRLIPGKSEAFYFRIDLVILPLIGALLALILINPVSIKASLFAGITWSGSITALLNQTTNLQSHENN
jgi:glucan phosphoethanolaminetransferase (alkaline phosphatase superfamily)